MQRYLIVLAALVTGLSAYCQPRYPVSAIPDSLKKNAHAVIREKEIFINIKNAEKAHYREHLVVTILDEEGKDNLLFVQYTDKFMQLESAEIMVYDAAGIQLNKYKKKDLGVDNAGEGLIEEGKVYFRKVSATTFPITVEFNYELYFNGQIDYPDYAIMSVEESVEQSSFTVQVPAELDLRYKAQRTSIRPTVTNDGKSITYRWQVSHEPALRHEKGSVGQRSRYPKVLISPNKFELDGYPGDMSSWKNFGLWYGQLGAKAINFNEEQKAFFRNLVKDIPDEREKVKKIYQFLQTNCRYVSIQLGIGGFKPFEASFVDKKKYGDCKALSNYTQACLDAVGIRSHQALINAGYTEAPVDPGFPQNSFNHVILCVPFAKDSVWLECTSRTNDFGVLGGFTENRNALLITPDGGVLAATPKSRSTDNIFESSSRILLNEDGTGTAQVTLHTKGEYKESLFETGLSGTRDEKKKYFVNQLGYIQPDKFDIRAAKDNGTAEITLEFEKIPDFTAGSKMFLNPRLYNIAPASLPDDAQRTQDYYFYFPYTETDTTVYVLPQGYTIESLPQAQKSSFDLGSFSTTYTYDEKNGTVTTTARVVLNDKHIPAARFTETKLFINDIIKEYTDKIVIRKK